MTDDFIQRLTEYKQWADNMNGRYQDQRNGISPRRRYCPDKYQEDRDAVILALAHQRSLKEAIEKLQDFYLARRLQIIA